MDKAELALTYFGKKFHCSQSVAAAYAEDIGLTEEQALKLGGLMGTGLRKGEVCGSCLGALMVLGMKYGQSDPDDIESRLKANSVCDKFLERFTAEYGTYICNELLGCDVRTKEGLEYAVNNRLFTEFCPKTVVSAVRIIEDIEKDETH